MATIQEITQGSSYTGSPHLGGSLGVGVALDTSPLQRLANYNFYKDRDLFEKKKVDDLAAANQIADIAAYDVTSPFKPYTEDLKGELAGIQEYMRSNPDALVYSRNPQKFTELQEKINRFKTKRKAATANDAILNAQKAAVEKTTDPALKRYYQSKLDRNVEKQFEGGLENAYNTQFGYISELKPEDYELPEVATTTRSFIKPGANKDFTTEVTYNDVEDLETKALTATQAPTDITQEEWFKNLSESDKKLELEGHEIQNRKRMEAQRTANTFKDAVDQFRLTPEGQGIDLDNVTDEQMKTLPDIIKNNIRSVNAYNKQIDELNDMVKAGDIKDPAGRVRTDPYRKMSLSDGLQDYEVVMLKAVQKNKNAIIQKVDKSATYHKLGLEYAQEARLSRPTAGAPPSAIENPAWQFGRHIERVRDFYTQSPTGKDLVVDFNAIDPDTKLALGIVIPKATPEEVESAKESGQETNEQKALKGKVIYRRDGSVLVGVKVNEDGSYDPKTGTPITLDALKQGYIDAVKGGLAAKGENTQGFQENAEQGFKSVLGSNNAVDIYRNIYSGGRGGGQQQGGGYSNVTRVKDKNGNIIQIGVKDGKWYNIQTGQAY